MELGSGPGILSRVLLIALIACPLPSWSQHASLSTNVLELPAINYGGSYYAAELSLLPDPGPPQLELIAALELSAPGPQQATQYRDGRLLVPQLDYLSESYWLILKQIGATRFQLEALGSRWGLNSSRLAVTTAPQWQRMPGDASDIGIGANGSIWLLGKDPRPGGFGIYYWDGGNWQRVDGAAVRIDVGPDGVPWTVNDKHQLHRWEEGRWLQMQGDARDIGIGADGSVWIAAGGGVYRWLGEQRWQRFSGSAVRVDVDPLGIPWVIDHSDDIHRLVNERWQRQPGSARDVGIGADGSVWVIGSSQGSGGHDIFRWDGTEWRQVPGSGRQLSVDQLGRPWVAGTGGELYFAAGEGAL